MLTQDARNNLRELAQLKRRVQELEGSVEFEVADVTHFINPITNERFAVTIKPLSLTDLISKHYPTLQQYSYFNLRDGIQNGLDFIIRKVDTDTIRKGLNAISQLSHQNYKGSLCNSKEIEQYFIETIRILFASIKPMPHKLYIHQSGLINILEIFLSAIKQDEPLFDWYATFNGDLNTTFLVAYNAKLNENDYALIEQLIKAHDNGVLVEITNIQQQSTNYRKTVEQLLFDHQLNYNSAGIFNDFSLEEYMTLKYHAVEYNWDKIPQGDYNSLNWVLIYMTKSTSKLNQKCFFYEKIEVLHFYHWQSAEIILN